ncbi:NAD(P)H-dependent glycerol-3-phosphate dehydrogenase [Ferrovibrio sp.]|uniref:NAD(P)H-dependent glycerol-3-phosphate dehydrogenase n=1 Tax=Ferrovibrio sp. TaxID=1917215 RepID=UPI0025BEE69B|nr:NAD(P)H-dependent glycerol-3-phosphate dehydrogenase [Ferrovibrio sp.]MBX3453405.1 NAD(P)-dependent glycerol-3-phosphate dehydrogenase [Ferrovibrio sp.]
MSVFNRIGVIGGGAWGTALAALAAEGGDAMLWARNADVVADVNGRHCNSLYLPDIALPTNLRATTDLADLAACDALLLAMPAQTLRAFARQIGERIGANKPLVLTAKGIEIASGALLGQVLVEELPEAPALILSGPTFAAEVARGLPTAATLAGGDAGLVAALAARLSRPTFRPYASDDPVGAQIGGAVKNVLAIACGIVLGRRLGDNARAALITRGLAEMTRLGLRLGGRSETLMGLSGLGDLVLTCSGAQSRNLSLGRALGEGVDLAAYRAGRRTVAEGEFTATALHGLCARLQLEMPICAAVHAILHQGADIDATIAALLSRPLKNE